MDVSKRIADYPYRVVYPTQELLERRGFGRVAHLPFIMDSCSEGQLARFMHFNLKTTIRFFPRARFLVAVLEAVNLTLSRSLLCVQNLLRSHFISR